jgi:F0F1-type ATP synthase assembly protein I
MNTPTSGAPQGPDKPPTSPGSRNKTIIAGRIIAALVVGLVGGYFIGHAAGDDSGKVKSLSQEVASVESRNDELSNELATKTTSSAESSGTTAATTPESASTPSCESLTTQGAHGVGSCEGPGGTSAKYAGVGHHLILNGMTMRYVSMTTAPSVSNESSTAKAHGTFVIVTVEVSNREHSAQEWKSEQSELLVNGSTYEEAFDAENGKDQHSLLWETGFSNKLQSGETRTGDLVYDLPDSALHALEHEGGLVAIRAFGEENENKEAYGGVLLLPKG